MSSLFFSSKKRNKHKKHTENVENKSEIIYGDEEAQNVNPVSAISLQDLKQAMEVFSINSKPAKTSDEALKKNYQFWSTQPVPRMGNILFHFVTFQNDISVFYMNL